MEPARRLCFAGRIRRSRVSATASVLASSTAPPRERTSCLRPKIARRSRLASRSTPAPDLRRLRAELGEHPAITAAQMGHRDPRMTLRVYTDVTGMQPKTRMGGLLGDDNWASLGTSAQSTGSQEDKTASEWEPESASFAGTTRSGSDGTRTRDLRRDRPDFCLGFRLVTQNLA
jgi:hypothetical protein